MSKILTKGTREHRKLQILADMMTLDSPNGYVYRVEDCYEDYGAGMMWTTICYTSDWGGVQVLSPREWDQVVIFADTVEEITKAYQEIRAGRFWGDKVKEPERDRDQGVGDIVEYQGDVWRIKDTWTLQGDPWVIMESISRGFDVKVKVPVDGFKLAE